MNAWLDSLPLANTGQSAKAIYEFLTQTNRTIFDPAKRFAALELLREKLNGICGSLQQHYIGQPIVLNEKKRKIAALAAALLQEMTLGYKSVIEATLKTGGRFNVQQLATATERALDYSRLLLLHHFKLYSSAPKLVWLEIHRIYSFARANGLHTRQIEGLKGTDTINEIYLKALLMGAANTFQMRQTDISRLSHELSEWSKFAKIQENISDETLFLIDCAEDQGPVYRHMISTESEPFQLLALDTTELVAYLQDVLRKPEVASNATNRSTQLLLRHLIRCWGSTSTRSFSRTQSDGMLQICVGLASSHFFMSGEDQQPEISEKPETVKGGKVKIESWKTSSLSNVTIEGYEPHANDIYAQASKNRFIKEEKKEATSADIWDAVSHRSSKEVSELHLTALDTPVKEQAAPTANFQSIRSAYNQQKGRLKNLSPGGFCLQLEGTVPRQLQAGELVVMQNEKEEQSEQWNIGAIRWVRRNGQLSVEFGVQLLAPAAQTVKLSLPKKDHRESLRGLLLPELAAVRQPATLLTPSLPYKVNDIIEVDTEEGVVTARLTRLVSCTTSYNQFEFNQLDQLNSTSASSAGNDADTDSDEFASVWTLI
ncbi:hypothetical protein DC094_17485 [Pelagibaculum spongiae]|uniref:PilZ domain-containing protein n=2 Tax=Pelagibaculum spongiae TaxID=2080658 RepID=A0A2V1GS38_9GAMM|nr:hypothetical protein DC094_17485 [Pelagibaculum spongiae]